MNDRAELADDRWCAGRRAVLAGVGAVGLAGVLTACGGDDATTTKPTPGPGSAAAPAPAGSTGTAGVLARTADIPVGGGTVVNGLLIVQPVAGTYRAYNAACPHQGVQVAAPKDGVATCPAHRSTFAIADGSRLSGQANRGLAEVPISVEGTDIVAG